MSAGYAGLMEIYYRETEETEIESRKVRVEVDNKKKKQLMAKIIVIVLVAAMIIPTVIYAIQGSV